MDGIVFIYVNFLPDTTREDQQAVIDLTLKMNQSVMDKINKETNYQVMIIPSDKESCRVEKLDFDKPHPRFFPKSHVPVLDEDKKYLISAGEEGEE